MREGYLAGKPTKRFPMMEEEGSSVVFAKAERQVAVNVHNGYYANRKNSSTEKAVEVVADHPP